MATENRHLLQNSAHRKKIMLPSYKMLLINKKPFAYNKIHMYIGIQRTLVSIIMTTWLSTLNKRRFFQSERT